MNPSGHLTDTYAVDNASSPAARIMETMHGPMQMQPILSTQRLWRQRESIPDINIMRPAMQTQFLDRGMQVLRQEVRQGKPGRIRMRVTYPFGYGLSYTTFEQKLENVEVNLNERTVTADVTVKNTGNTAGKDAVQLYVSVPYTDYDREHLVEKSAIQLLDYGKTEELKPGESTTVTITADSTGYDQLGQHK